MQWAESERMKERTHESRKKPSDSINHLRRMKTGKASLVYGPSMKECEWEKSGEKWRKKI